ncbi:MAG: hypothetical protein GY679_04390 [Mycoplasma sp.]|nr:hypothetical protein [Mycoplasma sp.]
MEKKLDNNEDLINIVMDAIKTDFIALTKKRSEDPSFMKREDYSSTIEMVDEAFEMVSKRGKSIYSLAANNHYSKSKKHDIQMPKEEEILKRSLSVEDQELAQRGEWRD